MTAPQADGLPEMPVVAHLYTDERDGLTYVSNACESERLPNADALVRRSDALARLEAAQAESRRLREALRRAREGFMSERATGGACMPIWREQTLEQIDAALTLKEPTA